MSETHSPQTPSGRESLSTFMDGEWEACADKPCVWLNDDGPEQSAHLQAWHHYHLIGQAIRAEELSLRDDPAAFVQRWRQSMSSLDGVHAEVKVDPSRAWKEAANQSQWRRVAGFFGLVAVGALAWQLWSTPGSNGSLLATSQPAIQLASEQGEGTSQSGGMIRSPEVDALLAQHRELGGVSALHGPAGFLRTATYGQASNR